MPIVNNQEFKVVQVATLSQYNDISSKDPATAYWVVGAKKIYLDGVAYGFQFTDDVTSTLLSGLIENDDTNSIDFTITNTAGKLRLKADAKVASLTKTWVAGTITDWNAGVQVYDNISATSSSELVSYLIANHPANLEGINAVARGNDGGMPTNYYYAKISTTGTGLLSITTAGITLLQEDIISIADQRINTLVMAKKGTALGFAELDSGGKVPTAQLPSYVDDVLEYANLAGFPATGEAGKIYIAQDTERVYRWTGTSYVNIATGNLVLGETSSTAYRGDRGKIAYDHTALTNNPHQVTKAQVGLGSVENYGIATQFEATTGSSNIKYMTPLRVKEAIDQFAQKVLWTVIS